MFLSLLFLSFQQLSNAKTKKNSSNLLGFDKSNTEGQIWGTWGASDFLDNIDGVSSQELKDNVSTGPLNTLADAKHIRTEVY